MMVAKLAEHGSLTGHLPVMSHTFKDRCRWFAQTASAVEYMHRKRVVHHDIKPDNLLVRWRGRLIGVITCIIYTGFVEAIIVVALAACVVVVCVHVCVS